MERTQAAAWLSLMLLLALVHPGAKSEMCRSWMFGIQSRFGPFRCPGRNDLALSQFCCGTCLQPYCCPWEELQLNQTACLTSGDLEGLAFEDLKATPTARPEWVITPSTVATTATQTSPTTTAVLKEVHPNQVPFILLALFLAASIGGAYWMVQRCWNQRFINRWLRRPAEDPSPLELVRVSSLSNDNNNLPQRPEAAVDTEARSPSVENLQGSCETLPCLDKPFGEQPSHPPSETPQRKRDYLVSNMSPPAVEGPVLEPAMEAKSAAY